ncbi:uncharacterized protein GGS25DRAFT_498577 [Hypoxylon fragiforme]|uniref:uncharacterized protein n=1 Tax=Hypoxylon fragiforme TaxID=63214 RepID=UPI0020C60150|nr:uncharacterized protein GGS25DRAFT_498577 [Hypoxylon fragiforme]KAI2605911.1 hypothetical protein GGS25DRAFT_498577 [Hypoxylon fragiforme]
MCVIYFEILSLRCLTYLGIYTVISILTCNIKTRGFDALRYIYIHTTCVSGYVYGRQPLSVGMYAPVLIVVCYLHTHMHPIYLPTYPHTWMKQSLQDAVSVSMYICFNHAGFIHIYTHKYIPYLYI